MVVILTHFFKALKKTSKEILSLVGGALTTCKIPQDIWKTEHPLLCAFHFLKCPSLFFTLFPIIRDMYPIGTHQVSWEK